MLNASTFSSFCHTFLRRVLGSRISSSWRSSAGRTSALGTHCTSPRSSFEVSGPAQGVFLVRAGSLVTTVIVPLKGGDKVTLGRSLSWFLVVLRDSARLGVELELTACKTSQYHTCCPVSSQILFFFFLVFCSLSQC